jgi:hypothetical protein
MPSVDDRAVEVLAERLRFQSRACEALGSSLYAGLLESAIGDLEARGPTWEALRGHEVDHVESALALRFMGAVNRLLLEGREPELAEAYAVEPPDPAAAWPIFRSVVGRNVFELREKVELPVQTNEAGRSAALLPGFLAIAAEQPGMPLRLLEVGASAGLNLRWDAYRYRAGGFAWGPEDSPLALDFELREGGLMPRPERVEVAERRGCDASPVDPATPEGRLTFFAYVWPDQRRRVERARAALEVAQGLPVAIDRESAGRWTERMLAEPRAGAATALFHSIVFQYFPEEEREAFLATVEEAGARASAEAPLAWLRMEPAGPWADVRLTLWPGGEERVIAVAGYHGSPVTLVQR